MTNTAILPRALVAELEGASMLTDLFLSMETLCLPFLHDAPLPVSCFPDAVAPATACAVLANLAAVSAETRTAAAALIWDELHLMLDAQQADYPTLQAMLSAEGAGRGFDDLQAPVDAQSVWPLLRFREIFLDQNLDGVSVNAIVIADVAWDMEHQIGLFFRNGETLIAATDPTAGV